MTKAKAPTITLNDGNMMPQLGLGVWRAALGEAKQAVLEAVNVGYRLIDTAMIYNNEEDVGAAIAECSISREELFITTKLWNTYQGTENVRPALEASLSRLRTDYIDLYLIHWPMPDLDLYVETWREFEKLRDEGLIKSIGVCNFEPEHLQRLIDESDTIPAVNQVELHPGFNQEAVRAYCKEHGIQVESWSPLSGGAGSASLLQNPTLLDLAEKYGKSPAQIVIHWHIQHGLIVIPKSVHPERIRQNIDVFDFELTNDEMLSIDSIESSRQGHSPYEMYRRSTKTSH